MAEIILTDTNFDAEVLQSDKPVIVDFWATWCGPCMMLAPVLHELSEELSDTVKVCKVNVDEQPFLASKFGIVSIPTVIRFDNGIPTKKEIGYRDKEPLKEVLGL